MACPGHPRLQLDLQKKFVDARHKAGKRDLLTRQDARHKAGMILV